MPRRDRPHASSHDVTAALRSFLATETAGGLLLVVAAVAALVWANSPWQASYRTLWHTELGLSLGRWSLELDLQHWVNDALMALFFLVVGMEVKRELTLGELRDRRQAALPVAAAVGGMVVPALLYVAVNAGGSGGPGWGIPMATDIAFALGVLALAAPRVPSGVRLFLLTLAIVDDIGAIVVIALFYSSGIEPGWLLVAVAAVVAVVVLRNRLTTTTVPFVALGALLWLALHEAGVHATLAGVIMGLLVPVTPVLGRDIVRSLADDMLDVFSPRTARETTRIARQAVSQLEWLEHELHGWSSLLVVPVFALANAGVTFTSDSVGDAVGSTVTIGVVLGLVVGKFVGITGGAWLATRLRVAALPEGVAWGHIGGAAALGGIGFTVSLFIASLAFEAPALVDEAKVGILVASVMASLVGALVLRRTSAPLTP